ncbi:MAG TPA: phage tail tape measure protein, partial [Coriobacteriia bacterium]|nr:phage tail tape measure protein [Coriobacteriia bacterium]
MSERSVRLILKAEVADFKRQMGEAAAATDKIPASAAKAETSLGRMVQSARYNRESWDRAGRTMTAFGTATLAGLALAGRAAVNWESQWTGVLKTVNGTDAELSGLEESLREMARTLPASHQEIAAVAEAAGQLGVQTPNVAAFTRVMIDLGETTNLSADEAATALAQLMNVMQTSAADVDNLGAAVVELGNNGASTERDIVLMAQRIAGAGKIIGLTEGEVLGMANALSSVGIDVEAGGTAISKIMIDMAKAVSTGSDDLTRFAEVAGMSADQFATAFEEDPASAIASFIEGLGRVDAAGGDVFTTLDTLGQSEVRVTRALLTMANSGDLLRD